MSNASGIFPCNTKPQTKRRQKGHAVNRMGSSFSCTSSLHSPSCPTFCCKKLLHGLLSVPDFISSSHSSQKRHLDFWKSKTTLSQGLVDKNIATLPTSSFKICNSDLGSHKANLFLQGGRVRGDLLRWKYLWSFLRCCPRLTQWSKGVLCFLLSAQAGNERPAISRAFLTVLKVSWRRRGLSVSFLSTLNFYNLQVWGKWGVLLKLSVSKSSVLYGY